MFLLMIHLFLLTRAEGLQDVCWEDFIRRVKRDE